MSSLLNQISNNEINTLEITSNAEDAFDNDDGSIHAFLDALKSNTSISSVRLAGDFLGCLRADSRSRVLQALGDVLDLKEVTLGHTLMMVEDVNYIVSKSTSLRSITLHDVVLQGYEQHFQALEATVYQHPSLKELDFSLNCETALKDIDLGRLKKTSACNARTMPAVKNCAIAKSA